jgi:hypothetical protein
MGREKLAAGRPDGMPKQLRYPGGRDEAFWQSTAEAVDEHLRSIEAKDRKGRK